MPRGGRRPGAGAPKGNFNAVKSGTSSRRMRLALTTLLVMPEYRHLIRFLLTGGEQAHRDVTDLLIATARILWERPVREDLRKLAEQAAAKYVATVGAVNARKHVRYYQRALGVDDVGRLKLGRDRLKTSADPAFKEFVRLLLGIKFDDDNKPMPLHRAYPTIPPNPESVKSPDKKTTNNTTINFTSSPSTPMERGRG
jgi:hypothetical protein